MAETPIQLSTESALVARIVVAAHVTEVVVSRFAYNTPDELVALVAKTYPQVMAALKD